MWVRSRAEGRPAVERRSGVVASLVRGCWPQAEAAVAQPRRLPVCEVLVRAGGGWHFGLRPRPLMIFSACENASWEPGLGLAKDLDFGFKGSRGDLAVGTQGSIQQSIQDGGVACTPTIVDVMHYHDASSHTHGPLAPRRKSTTALLELGAQHLFQLVSVYRLTLLSGMSFGCSASGCSCTHSSKMPPLRWWSHVDPVLRLGPFVLSDEEGRDDAKGPRGTSLFGELISSKAWGRSGNKDSEVLLLLGGVG